jgi:hypothetical protein
VRGIRRGAPSQLVVAAAGLAATAALLAGCGAAPADSPVAPRLNGKTAPPAGTHGEAVTLAQQLVSGLVLPSGAQPAHLLALPLPLRPPWGPAAGSADAVRLTMALQPIAAVRAFVLAHAPKGAHTTATGQQSGPAGLVAQDVYFDLRSLPPGIDDAALAIALVPRSARTTLIAAYAHVTWFPARTITEQLTVPDFRSVTVSARLLNPRPHDVTRTFTSSAIIASLADVLNSLHAAPKVATTCPGLAASYELRFSPRERVAPEVIASTAGCADVQVTTGVIPQPTLWDPHNALSVIAAKMLHISLPSAPPNYNPVSGPGVSGPGV